MKKAPLFIFSFMLMCNSAHSIDEQPILIECTGVKANQPLVLGIFKSPDSEFPARFIIDTKSGIIETDALDKTGRLPSVGRIAAAMTGDLSGNRVESRALVAEKKLKIGEFSIDRIDLHFWRAENKFTTHYYHWIKDERRLKFIDTESFEGCMRKSVAF